MKFIANIYQKIFMRVWVLALSALIFVFAVYMLTDLKNYKYGITGGYGVGSSQRLDENGVRYINVYINSKAKLIYTGNINDLFGLHGFSVDTDSFKLLSGNICLDVYQRKDGERVFVESIKSDKYSKNFYDIAYGRSIEIVPRTENVKIQYPAWRIYVPILLFILTVPLMALSGYLIVTEIIEKVRKEKESEKPVEL